MNKDQKIVRWFRRIAITEGISFLLLLFIAMPLKYLADWPYAVKYIGWAHGALFVAYLAMAFEVKMLLGKKIIWYIKAFIASVIPFGTFVFDKHLKKEEAALGGGGEW